MSDKNLVEWDYTSRFAPEALDTLKWYVYVYLDPTAYGEPVPFYIGKGKGNRAFEHLDDQSETEKVARIKGILDAGKEPRIDILAYGMSEAEALLVEACAIDLLGLQQLTNLKRGDHGSCHGRISHEDLMIQLNARPVKIKHKAILITINQCFRSGMSPLELREATRGTWRVGATRDQAKLALAVFQGVVREVYRIEKWDPACTTPYVTRDTNALRRHGRWEFVGEEAADLREQYVGRSVRDYFPKGSRNPICYSWHRK